MSRIIDCIHTNPIDDKVKGLNHISVPLTNDELLEKCNRGEAITSEDLGVDPPREDGFYEINNGMPGAALVIIIPIVLVILFLLTR